MTWYARIKTFADDCFNYPQVQNYQFILDISATH